MLGGGEAFFLSTNQTEIDLVAMVEVCGIGTVGSKKPLSKFYRYCLLRFGIEGIYTHTVLATTYDYNFRNRQTIKEEG